MLQRAARNAYSWWWASHIRTKQSKWLDQNLQDMEEKVEYILKIINEDGDSFAVRAEMYYRKRPELVNFVEDCFRGYRALAERYDHLSRDLQSANRTIAAVYPERVQLSMDEEDEEINFNAPPPFLETNIGNPPTALPAVPSLNLPKSPSLPKRKSKMPSRLMSKKGLVKIGGDDEKVVTKSSGLSKNEALEEIDKLQKGILALQTEKEFTKSSYENGLAKFWEIENRVTEMQAKVSSLQDDFGIGTVIEDDEARILMATAALKSCQETLAKLQEKQTQIHEEAKIENRRFQEAQQKFETLKEGHQSIPTGKQEISEEIKIEREDQYFKDLSEEAESVKQEVAKVNERVLLGVAPVTMSEFAEKIDELVDKVIRLETEVTSQTSLVKRLRSETIELNSNLQRLEEDKEIQIEEGSDSKSSKIRQIEEELRRVQSLNQNVRVQNQSLQNHFLVASSNYDQLSENLVNVKPDEEVHSIELFSEVGASPSENLFQHITSGDKKNGDIVYRDNNLLRDTQKYVPSKQKGFFDVVVEVGQLKAASKGTAERGLKDNSEVMSLGSNSEVIITKEAGKEEERNVVNISNQYATEARDGESLVLSSPLNSHNDLLFPSQMRIIGSGSNSMISKDATVKEVEKKDDILDPSLLAKTEDSNVMPSEGVDFEGLSVAGLMNDNQKYNVEKEIKVREEMELKEINVDGNSSLGFFPNHFLHKAQGENLSHSPSSPFNPLEKHSLQRQMKSSMIAEEENTVKPPSHINLEDALKNGLDTNASEVNPEAGFRIYENNLALDSDSNSKGGREKEVKKGDLRNLNLLGKADEDNFVEPHQIIQYEDFPKKGQVKYVSEDALKNGLDNGLVVSNHGQMSFTNGGAGTEDWYVSHPSNPFDDHYGITGSWNSDIIEAEKDDHFPDSASRIVQLGHSSENGEQVKIKARDEVDKDMEEINADEEDDEPNWRHLFTYGLEDREKMLLEEYTSTLRNYKQVKKKLSEAEKRSRASLFKTAVQIKVLKSSNASKDAEIQSLHQKLNLFQTNIDETPDLPSLEKVEVEGEIKKEEKEEGEIKKEEKEEGEIKKEEEQGEIKNILIDDEAAPIVSSIEEKIRMDIDDLLEENIDFWLRFSIALHQIQKFQTAFHDLQTELKGVKEKKTRPGSTATKQDQSEIRPIFKHLRDILTELTLWWENTKVLKEDLDHRLSSLSNIQAEISRLSSTYEGEREEGSELSEYQAAKFQGEVMNMKQENKKVADELRVGADRVKRLQIDIEKTLAKLDEELGNNQRTKSSSSRSRIPLRSFLFGVKLKKQKPSSLFACMTPALQKQYSDLSALPP